MKWTLIGQCCARHPIHPPLLKIGSYLDNSLNISLTGFPQTCGGLLCFMYSKFFVNDSIDALFNLFNLFPVSRVGGDRCKQSVKIDARRCQFVPVFSTSTIVDYDCANSPSFSTFFSFLFCLLDVWFLIVEYKFLWFVKNVKIS